MPGCSLSAAIEEAGTLAVKPWMIPIERWTVPPVPVTACWAKAPELGNSRTITATIFPPAVAAAEVAAGVVASRVAINKQALNAASVLVGLV
jgi:hypothetical protein